MSEDFVRELLETTNASASRVMGFLAINPSKLKSSQAVPFLQALAFATRGSDVRPAQTTLFRETGGLVTERRAPNECMCVQCGTSSLPRAVECVSYAAEVWLFVGRTLFLTDAVADTLGVIGTVETCVDLQWRIGHLRPTEMVWLDPKDRVLKVRESSSTTLLQNYFLYGERSPDEAASMPSLEELVEQMPQWSKWN